MIRPMQRFPEALAQAITAVDEAPDALGEGGPLDSNNHQRRSVAALWTLATPK
jgi:hypothetical protein